ncbi:hypothetical protein D9757_008354 [Collybiopsis confluens]|uniref:FAD/NAD(P)-binding domain-containing protein n=1 Tax=Collybiopsis confluens TaxID=2823264 RepID=A0A8H5HF43_9AGAR|nr:hypothetical protein D9757_008354 [Collybiopsis confluens]
MSNSESEKTTIVIVGAGYGGLSLLNNLSKTVDPQKHSVVLIDARPAFIPLPTTLRLVVSDVDDIMNQAIHPYGDHTFRNKLAGNAKYIHGSVVEIKFGEKENGGSVLLDSGEAVRYNILVLATGSVWPKSIDFPKENRGAIEEFVEARRKEFSKASDILLVGGGAVGIELAGELRDTYPSKSVTLIHREGHLLNATYPQKYRTGLQKQLEARNITVLTGDEITESDASKVSEGHFPETEVVTKNGKKLKADLIIPTWGTHPNTSYLPSDLLSSTGHVKILPTFQLSAHPNIFAFGDIIEWKEQKMAAKASYFHAPKVATNVVEYLRLLEVSGGSGVIDLAASKKSAKYNGSMEMIMITNGKARSFFFRIFSQFVLNGVLFGQAGGMGYFDVLWGIVVGNWLTAMMKSKTLMVSSVPGMTGYTPK